MSDSSLKCYTYNGPVMRFDECVANRWSASTIAVSEKKARSNLAFQYKKQHGMAPGVKISLPGKLTIEE